MMNFILDNISWIWVGVLVLSLLIEAVTMSLTTIWSAIAALPMIFIARTQLPLRWQVLLFVVICAALIVFTRPFAVKKLKIGRNKTNSDTLVGQEVLVVKQISEFDRGEVKARGGVIWTAASADNSVLEEGKRCVVDHIEGNTLFVK
ncbi:NfeD family protein [Treponema sp.]|uniref:NfeD family protein n=1 Tax=Treponema sp. TaxID=166 RepID=UPI003FD6C8CD